jgi:membrane protease subunit HflC
MSNIRFIFTTLILILFVVILSGLFTVYENERAIVLRLGKIETDRDGNPKIRQPGLNFKVPFITVARVFDTRLQTLDIDSSRIVTEQKKDLWVDYYIKWRIVDLPKFYTATGGNLIRVQTLIEQKANDGIRAEFGKRSIQEVVSGERRDIMKILREQVDTSASSLGVDVIDVRIKRIDLPTEVSSTVFQRMRSERARIATMHRAQGRADAEAIRAKADANVTVILATAESEGKKIRGEGNATAAKLYADAYNKDADFYSFYKSLIAYKTSFKDKRDLLVLQPDAKFFRYFANPSNKS